MRPEHERTVAEGGTAGTVPVVSTPAAPVATSQLYHQYLSLGELTYSFRLKAPIAPRPGVGACTSSVQLPVRGGG